jgi:hypothetical protein
VLSSGEGLPGRIARSRYPEWIEDVSAQTENYFLRNQIARAFGIRAGFGFPVYAQQDFVGIFVLFRERACPENPRLVQQAIAVANKILNGRNERAVSCS